MRKEMHSIRTELYHQALDYMKKELLDDETQNESTDEDSNSMTSELMATEYIEREREYELMLRQMQEKDGQGSERRGREE